MQQARPNNVDDIWLEAAAAGGLWASIEIIVGSQLHNLGIPLSGTVLASVGVGLLVALHRLWPRPGLVWRAGVICALMKSLSPSAVILGPMIGILIEALLLESGIRLFRGRPVGYLVGGALALCGALLQKVARLLLLYGPDAAAFVGGLYRFAVRQLHVGEGSTWVPIVALAGGYALLGSAAAAVGHVLGGRQIRQGAGETVAPVLLGPAEPFVSDAAPDEPGSAWLLPLHLVAVAAGLWVLGTHSLLAAFVVVVPYIGLCAARYDGALGRLRRPGFWLSLLIVTASTALLWHAGRGTFAFSLEGLVFGLGIGLRAVFVVTAFAAVGAELRGPLVRAPQRHPGLTQVYAAAGLAFSALPALLTAPRRGRGPKGPLVSLSGLVQQAISLRRAFESRRAGLDRGGHVFILAGPRGCGKTSFLREMLRVFGEADVRAGGVVADGVDRQGERTGFVVEDIAAGEQRELCRANGPDDWPRAGRFSFSPVGVAFGRQALSSARLRDVEMAVVDEVGPLELAQGGWSESLDRLFAGRMPTVVVVRSRLVDAVVRHWGIDGAQRIDLPGESPAEAAARVLAAVLRGERPRT